jgi:NADPH:quinone reductase-like Zn-dependent oxidoreductase
VDLGAKADFLRACGADETIDYQKTDFADQNRQYDLIFDLVGTRPVRRIVPVLKPGGRYRLIGGTMRAMFSTLIIGSIRSMLSTRKMGIGVAEGDPKTLARIGRAAVLGQTTPRIAEIAPLSRVPDMLAKVGSGLAQGKVVIVPGQ